MHVNVEPKGVRNVKVLTAAIAGLVMLSCSALPAHASTAAEKTKLGNQLLGQGLANDALIFYDQAVDINPYYWPAYLNRGKALLRLGQTRYAMDDFKKTLQLNPDASEARRYLGGGRRSSATRRSKPVPIAKSETRSKSTKESAKKFTAK